MITLNKILQLTKRLFPTGRAWRIPTNSTFEKVLSGLAESELRALQFSESILNSILPDNSSFTKEDAAEWERRLGLPVLPDYTNLETRKSIILRKYNFPGGFLNRQNYRYIEYQLQLAGYDVYVYENLSGTINLLDTYLIQHGEDTEHGDQSEHGASEIDLIANSYQAGEVFDLPDAKGVFYIAGATISTPAVIAPQLREAFRKLVLTLKPVNTVAVLNVIYANEGNIVAMSGDNLVSISGDNIITN